MVNFYSPEAFNEMFPTTRIILDGIEIPVKKPSNPRLQQLTWSSYKNRNRVKSVPGVTPGALVSWILPASGGHRSDFLLREGLSEKGRDRLVEPKDSIMVNKGFDIQDLFAPMDVTVNIPTFLKSGTQFYASELERDR